MKYTLTVQCGEKTCAKTDETGAVDLCQFVRITTPLGADFHCGLSASRQALIKRDGWLMRSEECLNTLNKVDE